MYIPRACCGGCWIAAVCSGCVLTSPNESANVGKPGLASKWNSANMKLRVGYFERHRKGTLGRLTSILCPSDNKTFDFQPSQLHATDDPNTFWSSRKYEFTYINRSENGFIRVGGELWRNLVTTRRSHWRSIWLKTSDLEALLVPGRLNSKVLMTFYSALGVQSHQLGNEARDLSSSE